MGTKSNLNPFHVSNGRQDNNISNSTLYTSPIIAFNPLKNIHSTRESESPAEIDSEV